MADPPDERFALPAVPWWRRSLRSFRYAAAGAIHLVRTQPNAWIHVFAAAVVIALGAWLHISPAAWAVLVLTMSMVLALEAVNTAIEAAVDLASPRRHPLAKVAKDCAAGAVLIASVGAVAVGLLILGPPLYARLTA